MNGAASKAVKPDVVAASGRQPPTPAPGRSRKRALCARHGVPYRRGIRGRRPGSSLKWNETRRRPAFFDRLFWQRGGETTRLSLGRAACDGGCCVARMRKMGLGVCDELLLFHTSYREIGGPTRAAPETLSRQDSGLACRPAREAGFRRLRPAQGLRRAPRSCELSAAREARPQSGFRRL